MQVQISPADYLDAVRLGIRPRPVLAVIGGVLVLLGLVGLALIVRSVLQGRAGWNEAIGIFALGFLPFWYWLYLPWWVNRMYLQHRSLHEPYSVALEDQGLRFQTPNAEALLPWQHLHRWRESRSVFALYQSDALFHIIPKRCFASPFTEEVLREALLQNAGPANKAIKPAKP